MKLNIRCKLFGHKPDKHGVELDVADANINQAGYKKVVCARCGATEIQKFNPDDYRFATKKPINFPEVPNKEYETAGRLRELRRVINELEE